MLLPFGGKVPRDEGAVFVAPNATVLGDVVLGPQCAVRTFRHDYPGAGTG